MSDDILELMKIKCFKLVTFNTQELCTFFIYLMLLKFHFDAVTLFWIIMVENAELSFCYLLFICFTRNFEVYYLSDFYF